MNENPINPDDEPEKNLGETSKDNAVPEQQDETSKDNAVPEQQDETSKNNAAPEQDDPLSDLEFTSESPSSEDLPVQDELPPDEETPPGKFDFFKKQPLYIKIITSLLLVSSLLWFGMPKCSSSPHPEKNYMIALNGSWYPLQLMNKERSMTNFCKVLFGTIAANQNIKMRIIETGPNLFQLLDRGECDGVISILPPVSTSKVQYISSETIYQLGVVLVVRNASSITSSDQISGKIIGTIGNNSVLMRISAYPTTVFSNYENASQALVDLENRVIDGIIMDTLQAYTYMQGLYAGNFKIVYPPLINEGIELYLRKDEDAEKFMRLFNEGLEDLRKSGAYNVLIEQWGLVNTEIVSELESKQIIILTEAHQH